MLGRGEEERTMIRPSNFSSGSTGPRDERAASSRRLSLSHHPRQPFIPLRRETRNGERGGPRGVERVGFETRDTALVELFLDESAIVPAAS